MFRSNKFHKRQSEVQSNQNSYNCAPMQNNYRYERRDEPISLQHSRNSGQSYDEYSQIPVTRVNYDRNMSQGSQNISRNSGLPVRRSYEDLQRQPNQRMNRFGPRTRNQKSSLSCQDTHVEPLGVNIRERYLDDTKQQRSISRDATSLDLMRVSPERVEEDFTKTSEDFQSKFDITKEKDNKQQKQSQNDSNQLETLTQLLSQMNLISLTQSQMSNVCSQNLSLSNMNEIETSQKPLITSQNPPSTLKADKAVKKAPAKKKKTENCSETEECKQEANKEKEETKKKSDTPAQKTLSNKNKKTKVLKKKTSDKDLKDLSEKVRYSQESVVDMIAKVKCSTLLNNHYKNVQSNLDHHYNLRFLLNRIRCVKRQINCKIGVIKSFNKSKLCKQKGSNKPHQIENKFIPEDTMTNSEILAKMLNLNKMYDKLLYSFNREKLKIERSIAPSAPSKILETREEDCSKDRPLKKQRNGSNCVNIDSPMQMNFYVDSALRHTVTYF